MSYFKSDFNSDPPDLAPGQPSQLPARDDTRNQSGQQDLPRLQGVSAAAAEVNILKVLRAARGKDEEDVGRRGRMMGVDGVPIPSCDIC